MLLQAGTTAQAAAKDDTYKVVDLFAALFVCESHIVVCCHNAFASPCTNFAAQIGLIAFAHGALCTECLHATASAQSALVSQKHIPSRTCQASSSKTTMALMADACYEAR